MKIRPIPIPNMVALVLMMLSFILTASLSDATTRYMITDLGTLGGPAPRTLAHAINNSAQVAGWSTTFGGRHAFLWEDGVMTDLGTLGGTASNATAINDLGQIVGAIFNPSNVSLAEIHLTLIIPFYGKTD